MSGGAIAGTCTAPGSCGSEIFGMNISGSSGGKEATVSMASLV